MELAKNRGSALGAASEVGRAWEAGTEKVFRTVLALGAACEPAMGLPREMEMAKEMVLGEHHTFPYFPESEDEEWTLALAPERAWAWETESGKGTVLRNPTASERELALAGPTEWEADTASGTERTLALAPEG